MKKVFLVLGVLVVAGGFFLLKPSKEKLPMKTIVDDEFPTPNDTTEHSLDREKPIQDTSIREIVTSHENTLTAELVDVSGGSSNGTGYILRMDGKLYHFVEASLPAPQGNNKYEGWLVKQGPELMFFSTGVMESGGGGGYTLSYSSEDISEGYDFVVITEETVVDETPEAHILEGTAR